MCGHVGAAGNIWKAEKEAFRTLLILDRIRGPHATGIGYVNKKNQMGYMKATGTPDDLFAKFQKDGLDDGIVDHQVKALIGHNRWATVGAKVGKNAHPFLHGHILGAHNGTLTRHHLSNFPRNKEFEVDSECVINSLAVDGFEDTMDKIHGAWTLIWYDSKEEKMNFIRNKERPLFMCWNEIGDCLFWASEKWMLQVALSRHNIKFGDIEEIQEDKLYQLEIKGEHMHHMKNVGIEQVKEHSGFKPKVGGTPFQGAATTTSHGPNTYRNTEIITIDGQRRSIGWFAGSIWSVGLQMWVKDIDPIKALPNPNINSNVVPITVGKKTADWKRYKELKNKEIDFRISGSATSKNTGTPYFKGVMVGLNGDMNEDMEVRVYGHGHTKQKIWAEWDGYWNARVKNVVDHKGERYVLIDLRSMEAREYGEDDDAMYSYYGVEKISLQAWEEKTKCGCGYCTEVPRIEEHEFVTWINPIDFLCADCSVNPTIMAGIKSTVAN